MHFRLMITRCSALDFTRMCVCYKENCECVTDFWFECFSTMERDTQAWFE